MYYDIIKRVDHNVAIFLSSLQGVRWKTRGNSAKHNPWMKREKNFQILKESKTHKPKAKFKVKDKRQE